MGDVHCVLYETKANGANICCHLRGSSRVKAKALAFTYIEEVFGPRNKNDY